jgi:hypothetical protein
MTEKMKQNDFDYQAAWFWLATPSWKKLLPNRRNLYLDAIPTLESLHQAADLKIPLSPENRVRFDAFTSEALSQLARTIYFCGHWRSGDQFFPGAATGATWKFSNWCDQVLAGRLDLPGKDGSWQVHEGFLRRCVSWKGGWSWAEIGPATAELYAAASTCAVSGETFDRDIEAMHVTVYSTVSPWAQLWLDTKLFVYDPERWRRAQCLAALSPPPTGCTAVKIDRIGLPHLFMITAKHISRSKTMYLEPSAAPCGICQKDFAEHSTQETLFLSIPCKLTSLADVPGLHEWLTSTLALCKTFGIEGFAFIEPKAS